jgi:hypothetical protein
VVVGWRDVAIDNHVVGMVGTHHKISFSYRENLPFFVFSKE